MIKMYFLKNNNDYKNCYTIYIHILTYLEYIIELKDITAIQNYTVT